LRHPRRIYSSGEGDSVEIRGATSRDVSVVPGGLARIAILGGAGAGKSTLARRIGEVLGLPVVHLDLVVFGPGWSRIPIPLARQRLAAALEPGAWVVEGTYPRRPDPAARRPGHLARTAGVAPALAGLAQDAHPSRPPARGSPRRLRRGIRLVLCAGGAEVRRLVDGAGAPPDRGRRASAAAAAR